jgi:2,5-dioxopentanoate dehydrogenase
MQLTGTNLIGGVDSVSGKQTFHAVNPATGKELSPGFHEATYEQIDLSLSVAEDAFGVYSRLAAEQRADFLDRIADEITALGDELLDRCQEETALPQQPRLVGERGRTVNQIKMFAGVVREGSWVEARIDHAIPDRQPIPKPDVRRMLTPLGPVVIFGASNFPLAFSVAGGDTASALAAGCTVVVKAHPAHPGTSELIGRAIQAAADATGMPKGVFSLVQGTTPDTGLAMVRHPLAQAVGFTGSLRGGRALFDAAAARPNPIPVYAEMGSVNPVFVLPGAMGERGDAIAQGLVQSVTLGVGQFCTNPGVVAGLRGQAMDALVQKASKLIEDAPPGTMLHAGIHHAYADGLKRLLAIDGVQLAARSKAKRAGTQAGAAVCVADAEALLKHDELTEEVFGPCTVIIAADSPQQLEDVARRMQGQLTATIHGNEADLTEYADLVYILRRRVGRLLFNGFPTGVEVCPSMHHGGPYPATTDSRITSVGTAASTRVARPICYQGFPQAALPPELQDDNPRDIWRLVDNQWLKG